MCLDVLLFSKANLVGFWAHHWNYSIIGDHRTLRANGSTNTCEIDLVTDAVLNVSLALEQFKEKRI